MRYLAGIAAAAVVLGGLAFTVPAQASTSGCTGGVYSGYCGTQTDAESTPLSWDVFQQHAVSGNKIIGYGDSSSDKALDFFTFAFNGGSSKIFEYAPGGVASNLCVSEPSQAAGLVLRPCSGSEWQQFTAVPSEGSSSFTWKNGATGDLVGATGLRGQLTGAKPVTLTQSFEWTFAS
jgi:hypothetical protein